MRYSPVVAFLFIACACPLVPAQDWPTFGWDVGRSSAPNVATGLSAANIGQLTRQQVTIDGTVDGSVIYLRAVTVGGAAHDAFFVTTTYGKTLALDADNGAVLWEHTPESYESLAGSYRITNATPVADDDRAFIYAAAPDGMIRKLAVADGRVIWAAAVTRLAEREKIASPLSFFRGRVIAATDGYIGDRPPYQGHVAVLDAATGALLHVWNSLSSDRHELLVPSSVPESDSGIWGRAGVVIESETGNLYIATGNGTWDGAVNWGDSVIELDPDATRILGNYTPVNTADLDAEDEDLGSTSPVLLGSGLIAQGGKDRIIRVLDWRAMQGTAPHRGGEASIVPTPSRSRLFTAPALLKSQGVTWLFAADNGATAAWTLAGRTLKLRWRTEDAGTSPVAADGMLFVYDPRGGLRIYEAAAGRLMTTLACGPGHWNSPVVADGRIALPEGNANAHRTSGVLNIWRLPRTTLSAAR
ncbi:MAG TPA: PQQ-binding-like beta-propeller repeat protein [Spirochaetia bacterium]|nr:PQQ-binding-like beta-propeller repeat protein [Spirochaetia bacterium]